MKSRLERDERKDRCRKRDDQNKEAVPAHEQTESSQSDRQVTT
jgi:hypothetical protein